MVGTESVWYRKCLVKDVSVCFCKCLLREAFGTGSVLYRKCLVKDVSVSVSVCYRKCFIKEVYAMKATLTILHLVSVHC